MKVRYITYFCNAVEKKIKETFVFVFVFLKRLHLTVTALFKHDVKNFYEFEKTNNKR